MREPSKRRARRALTGASLGTPFLIPRGQVRADGRLQTVLVVSSHRAGFHPGELDPGFAEAMIESLGATANGEVLERLPAGAEEEEVARQFVSAWYSGLHLDAPGLVACTFEDALATAGIDRSV